MVALRKKPKRLRVVQGENPPEGYVYVERRRKGLIISGSAVFGGVYLLCVVVAPMYDSTWPLAIPVAGPMIAGYRYKDDPEDDPWNSNDESEYRLLGTLGTLAQVAGITLFAIGLASRKKMWLRQDLAGLSIQFTPTVIGERQPGLGVFGRF